MVEFHVQSSSDREKIIIGLVNSGHTVKVVEKPDTKRYLGILYYVQVEGDDLKNDQCFTKADLMAINQMKQYFTEYCKSSNGANIYYTTEGTVDLDKFFEKLNF